MGLITIEKLKSTTNTEEITTELRKIADIEQKFLEEKLAKFASLHGVTNIAESRTVRKDNQGFKLRYVTRDPAMQSVIDAEINNLIGNGQI